MTTDTPSDLVCDLRERARIRRQISSRKSVSEGKTDRIADQLDAAADRIEQLEAEVMASEQARDGFERELAAMREAMKRRGKSMVPEMIALRQELAEAEKFRDYFERESVIWRKRAEKAGHERDEALISALGMEYDENGWQDLARAALDMYGRKP